MRRQTITRSSEPSPDTRGARGNPYAVGPSGGAVASSGNGVDRKTGASASSGGAVRGKAGAVALATDTSGRASSPARAVRALVRTEADPAGAVARLALGAMILPHGLQKVFGIFGGFGFEGTMAYFTETLGLPWILGFLAIAAESLGGLALIVGAAGRLAALGVGSVMLVAGVTHFPNGFFMNWYGTLPAGAEGWEFHVLALGLAAVVLLRGSGAASLDRRLEAALPEGAAGS